MTIVFVERDVVAVVSVPATRFAAAVVVVATRVVAGDDVGALAEVAVAFLLGRLRSDVDAHDHYVVCLFMGGLVLMGTKRVNISAFYVQLQIFSRLCHNTNDVNNGSEK